MSVSTTETKTFFGVVVAKDENDTDPYGMGRVKVLCPSIHHKDISVNDLPWCTISAAPGGLGDHTFQRQLTVGSIVEVYFSGGTKSSGQGIIRSVINGVHTEKPQNEPKNSELLTCKGYIKNAREMKVDKASGPSQIGEELKTESLPKSGLPYEGGFITTETELYPMGGIPSTEELFISGEYKEFPNMHDREGIDSSLTSLGFVRTNKPIKVISTAEQWIQHTFDTGYGKTDVPPVKNENQDYEFTEDLGVGISDPVLKKGYKNFCDKLKLKYKTDHDTVNFSKEGDRCNLEIWKNRVKGKLSGVKTHADLQNVLHEVQTYNFLQETLKEKDSATVDTPFGPFQRINYYNGNLEFIGFPGPNAKKWDFIRECINTIPNARATIEGGSVVCEGTCPDNDGACTIAEYSPRKGLFTNSLVPGEVFLRLNLSAAKKVKKDLRDFACTFRPQNIEFARFASGEYITIGPCPDDITIKGWPYGMS